MKMDTIGITVITVPIIIIYDYAVLLYESALGISGII